MGGGDLNMKKSWHPLLLKNQEQVWLKEKQALEEKKKLDQLRKEKEEERQLQELQRLQEEQTGKKRTERLDWMYTTPATGTSQNPNDLEDYLLGKKRVDKILTADDNAKIGASHKNFIAIQNANTARDIAAKIREDPLLAIKQQEQAAYEALMKNPLRLREMQERNGLKSKNSKKDRNGEKAEKRRKAERRGAKDEARRRSRSMSPDRRRRSHSRDSYSRSRPLPSSRRHGSSHRADDYDSGRGRSRSPIVARLDRYDGASNDGPAPSNMRLYPRSDESDDATHIRHDHHNSLSRSPMRRSGHERSPSLASYPKRQRTSSPRRRSRSPYGKRPRMSSPQYRAAPSVHFQSSSNPEQDRASRLASMTSDAQAMNLDRQRRLTDLLEKEKAELAAENTARAKSKGMASFLNGEQKKVFGGSGGLEERLRRGRAALDAEALK